MTWFITKSKETFINRKEIPIDNDVLYNLPDESQPVNIWQAMLQAAPGTTVKIPMDQPNLLKEALLDCMEMLTEQDQYIIDALIYEQLTYPKLAKRMGISAPHAWRLAQAAYARLRELLMMHSTLRDYLVPDEH